MTCARSTRWCYGCMARQDAGATTCVKFLRATGTVRMPGFAPEVAAKRPAFVVAPQCPEGESWASYPARTPAPALLLVIGLLHEIQQQYSIDDTRIYVAGQSMGGDGTAALIGAHPTMFAAAVVIAGVGDAKAAPTLKQMRLWIFAGAKDPLVRVERVREWVAALREAGASPRYSEYPGLEHVIWRQVFAEKELVSWVFAQVSR
jgi:predicted peptidase